MFLALLSNLYGFENLQSKYNIAKVNYLKAVLNGNTKNEILNLKLLINTGKKLKKNISRYEKKLKKYKQSSNNKKTENQKFRKSKTTIKKNLYNIKSVVSKDNFIIIEFNTKITKDFVKFYEKKEKGNWQDIFDIKGNFKGAYPTKLQISGVKQIVIKQEKKNILRILLEDKRNIKTIYIINKNKLSIKVLDLKEKTTVPKKIAKISKFAKIQNYGNKIIVLDPGHGGRDSGAIGSKRIYEKNIVFKIAKYLETLLKHRGYKTYLTRNSDKFITLRNRTLFANRKKADMFISIHANATSGSKMKKIQGIETFFLSPSRSNRAKKVAALENKSDIKIMGNSTKQVFLESLNRAKITASNKLSIDIHKNVLFSTRKIYKNVRDMGVREAPFWVLVGAQMPAILIETGYITHPEESKRLSTTRYQKAIALGIANGIDSYILKNP